VCVARHVACDIREWTAATVMSKHFPVGSAAVESIQIAEADAAGRQAYVVTVLQLACVMFTAV